MLLLLGRFSLRKSSPFFFCDCSPFLSCTSPGLLTLELLRLPAHLLARLRHGRKSLRLIGRLTKDPGKRFPSYTTSPQGRPLCRRYRAGVGSIPAARSIAARSTPSNKPRGLPRLQRTWLANLNKLINRSKMRRATRYHAFANPGYLLRLHLTGSFRRPSGNTLPANESPGDRRDGVHTTTAQHRALGSLSRIWKTKGAKALRKDEG